MAEIAILSVEVSRVGDRPWTPFCGKSDDGQMHSCLLPCLRGKLVFSTQNFRCSEHRREALRLFPCKTLNFQKSFFLADEIPE